MEEIRKLIEKISMLMMMADDDYKKIITHPAGYAIKELCEAFRNLPQWPIESIEEYPKIGLIQYSEEFGDPETLLNSRQWIREAIEARGAKVIGSGTGLGQADVDIMLEGFQYNVSIRPITTGKINEITT